MSLEQGFYLSQSLASIAVVGSLIYLGLQRSAELTAASAPSCNRGAPIGPATHR